MEHSMQTVLSLPPEITLLIATELMTKDIYALVQSHPQFHCILHDYLVSKYQKLHGDAALYFAVEDGSHKVVDTLLDRGANVCYKSNYWTCTTPWRYAKHHRRTGYQDKLSFRYHPISPAALNGNTDLVIKLLDRGADMDFKDLNGLSPLSLAAQGGHIDTVRALVARGANLLSIDCDGQRAIANAAEQGHHEIEDYLVDVFKAKHPHFTHTLKTEMHFMMFHAAARADAERINQLLHRGVEVDSQLPVNSHTPLCAAIWRGAPLGIIKLLLEHGASPNSVLSRERNRVRGFQKPRAHAPLQGAIDREDCYEIVLLLILYGMRLDINCLTLRKMIRSQRLAGFSLLVEAGMDVQSDPRLLKSLHRRATELQRQDFVDLLASMGAEQLEDVEVRQRHPMRLSARDRRDRNTQSNINDLG